MFNVLVIFSVMIAVPRLFSLVQIFFVTEKGFQILLVSILDDLIQKELNRIARRMGDPMLRNFNSTKLFIKSRGSTNFRALDFIEMYRRHFQIRIFHLCKVDLQFNVMAIIFVINYVALVTQTSLWNWDKVLLGPWIRLRIPESCDCTETVTMPLSRDVLPLEIFGNNIFEGTIVTVSVQPNNM